jgi:hypothetical protein
MFLLPASTLPDAPETARDLVDDRNPWAGYLAGTVTAIPRTAAGLASKLHPMLRRLIGLRWAAHSPHLYDASLKAKTRTPTHHATSLNGSTFP